ncbi:preprotein translocase subunit SecG [Agathobacter sp.]
MATLKTVISIAFIIVSVVITIVILFQEGKSAGLGTIAGVADTYWGKNKGRSKEGRLVKATIACVVLYFILSIVLNLGIW